MMRRALPILILLAGLGADGLLARSGEADPEAPLRLQDRVVAEVGGTPVTRRELLLVASLIEARVVAPDERPVLEAAMRRLADQLIIRQELLDSMGDAIMTVDTAAMAARIEAHCGGADKLAAIRTAFDVSPAEYERLVRLQALVVEFLRTYFRPFVVIAPEEITKFYTDELLPQLPPDVSIPPVEQVRSYIQQILEQRKINVEFENWIAQRRQEAQIRLMLEE
jgi:hypothetical protein